MSTNFLSTRWRPDILFPAGFPQPEPDTILRGLVRSVQERTGISGDAILVSIVAAFSVPFSSRFDVNSIKEIPLPLSLYSIFVMESGTGKTLMFESVFGEIRNHSTSSAQQREDAMDDYNRKLRAWEKLMRQAEEAMMRIDDGAKKVKVDPESVKIMRSKKPVIPSQFKIYRTKVSTAGLLAALSEYLPIGILVNSDAGDVLGANFLKDTTTACDIWSGQTLILEQYARETIISDPRFSISLATQPLYFDKFIASAGKKAISSGLLGRFLPVFCSQSPVDLNSYSVMTNPIGKQVDFVERLRQELDLSFGNEICKESRRRVINISLYAKEKLKDFHYFCEQIIMNNVFVPDVIPSIRKGVENATRIAAILTLIESPDATEVTSESAQFAVNLMKHLINMLNQYLVNSIQRTAMVNAELLYQYIFFQSQLNYAPVRRSDILKFGPYQTRNKAALDAALSILFYNRKILFQNIITSNNKKASAYIPSQPSVPPFGFPSLGSHPYDNSLI